MERLRSIPAVGGHSGGLGYKEKSTGSKSPQQQNRGLCEGPSRTPTAGRSEAGGARSWGPRGGSNRVVGKRAFAKRVGSCLEEGGWVPPNANTPTLEGPEAAYLQGQGRPSPSQCWLEAGRHGGEEKLDYE